ncbi:MAG: 30S ribosomal protein S12 methylthiotransferase RimO [Prevotella sp.]|nr:30S ribosomal protein S12 methylthiotransferase RimO [Bacteroides sp.]MCM1366887.1 30S ribosomal protein S12 methylthiotransferase RimO [Prevotella sp.]MCM1437159.1 30S ribosomal protein S12 methylthiotransferase RimO [Prevotella sp.]
MTIDVITMGCSKNLVDSERLLKKLADKGYKFRHDPEAPAADYVVVNTCGFIQDAKEESINILLSLGEAKKRGEIGKLVVMGCLSERYMDELKQLIPEVDLWYGKFDWKNFIASLPDVSKERISNKDYDRIITTPSHYAYIKISEGCNRFCAFCAIPLITGRHTSRNEAEIMAEVKVLVKAGVKEFNIIAQDLSSFGLDSSGEHRLATLIDNMAQIEGVEWIRLHYAYPADFPEDILDVMAKRKNVCSYLDIALQHISDKVLTNMRRHFNKKQTIELIRKIRGKVPGVNIRTTLMVGFPGEGEAEFEELMEFVKEAKFERLGAFAYSEEEDTWAAKNLEDNVPYEVKQSRLNKLLDLQEKISREHNKYIIGKTIKVIVDRIDNETLYCRSEYDSPDVDQEIIVTLSGDNRNIKPGDFINVEIVEALEFQLLADIKR